MHILLCFQYRKLSGEKGVTKLINEYACVTIYLLIQENKLINHEYDLLLPIINWDTCKIGNLIAKEELMLIGNFKVAKHVSVMWVVEQLMTQSGLYFNWHVDYTSGHHTPYFFQCKCIQNQELGTKARVPPPEVHGSSKPLLLLLQ